MKLEKILFVPDTHVPYHSKRAWELLLRVGRGEKFDRIVILGDFADFHQVSFHEKSLERRASFGAEVKAVNACLDQLDALGAKRKQFVSGNHEHRFNRYLAERAPELADLPGHTVPELFRLRERGWSFTEYRDHIKIGKLYVTHDEGSAGALACVAARSTFNACVVIGHCHALTVSYAGDARGSSRVGVSAGWLGDASKCNYMHRVKAAKWQLGFVVGMMEPSGVVHLQAIPIVNNRCVVNGRMYGVKHNLEALGIHCHPECGEGWAAIVHDCLAKVYDAIGGPPDVLQIKEKFGGLRIYLDPDSLTMDEETDRWIHECVKKAESQSWKTCETCGAPGELRKGGWWKTLCDECEAKR